MKNIDNPLVSVIMPAYNATRYIRQSIDSILQQTYKNIELIIIDDCSKDDTLKVITSYKDPRIIVDTNDTNLGYVKTCNRLFTKCNGDFIAFQDADDFSDPRKIELQLKAFEEDDTLGVCGTNFVAYSEDRAPLFCSNYKLTHEDVMKEIPGFFNVKPSSFLLKREVYQSIGGYNEFWDRIGCEDYDWFDKIAKQYKFRNLRAPLYHYIYSPNSITRTIDDPRKLYVNSILEFVVKERNEQGADPIETNSEELHEYLNKLSAPYDSDISYLPRLLAGKALYNQEPLNALKFSVQAVVKKPFKLENWRTLFYIFRKCVAGG